MMTQRQFLHMMGNFLEVSDKIQHTTPNQFEQMIHSTPNDFLQQLFSLEQEIKAVRIVHEQYTKEEKPKRSKKEEIPGVDKKKKEKVETETEKNELKIESELKEPKPKVKKEKETKETESKEKSNELKKKEKETKETESKEKFNELKKKAKGGDMTITNLRPICASCNLSMGTRSMNEFTLEFFGWDVNQ